METTHESIRDHLKKSKPLSNEQIRFIIMQKAIELNVGDKVAGINFTRRQQTSYSQGNYKINFNRSQLHKAVRVTERNLRKYVSINKDDIEGIKYFLETKNNSMENFIFIFSAFHELIHLCQDNYVANNNDNLSELLRVSIILSENRSLYLKYHDQYLFEYHANVLALLFTLEEIESQYKGCFTSNDLNRFNMYIAEKIIAGYVVSQENEKSYTPVTFLRFLCQYHKDYRIDEKKLDIAIEEENNKKEYILNDIMMGRTVSFELLDIIYDISKGHHPTVNIFAKLDDYMKAAKILSRLVETEVGRVI